VTTPLLANDSDPDEDALTVTTASGLDMSGNPITLTTTPQDIYDENGVLAGQANLDASGNIIFTADTDFQGEVPVDYTATDGTDTDDATLVITVEPSDATDNDTHANDDASTGLEGETLTGNIINNDSDPEGDDQDITLIDTDGDGIPDLLPVAATPIPITEGGVTVGNLTIDPETGEYSWTPEPGFTGTVNIPYTTSDGTDTDTATLYLTSLPTNETVAENDINQTPQDTDVSGNILTNDTDEDGDIQTVQTATGLDNMGMPINIPVDGTPTDVYDENNILAGTIAM